MLVHKRLQPLPTAVVEVAGGTMAEAAEELQLEVLAAQEVAAAPGAMLQP